MCQSSRNPTRFHCEQLRIRVSYTLLLLSTITQWYSVNFHEHGINLVTKRWVCSPSKCLQGICWAYCQWITDDAFQTSHSCPIFPQRSRPKSNSLLTFSPRLPQTWHIPHWISVHPHGPIVVMVSVETIDYPGTQLKISFIPPLVLSEKFPHISLFLYHNYHRPSSGPWHFHLNEWNNLLFPTAVRIFLFKTFNGSLSLIG